MSFTDNSINLTQYIEDRISQLRNLSQLDARSLWYFTTEDLPIDEVFGYNYSKWQPVEINHKGHIAWDAGKQVIWLKQEITIPTTLNGYPLTGLNLRICLRWWNDFAQIYVDEKLIQEGDLFECAVRILISDRVTPGDKHTIALRLVSPGHDPGALVRSTYIYEQPKDSNKLEPSFIADELQILSYFLTKQHPEKLEKLSQIVNEINWESLPNNPAEFERSLNSVRQHSQSLIPTFQSPISLVGHSHLDMAWLWAVDETWDAAQRTFGSALQLMEQFPELTFSHSTPALYEWIELNRLDMFDRIQQQVEADRWEVVGGLWVEPELNIISGESIARHLLYGQAYTEAKFGEIAKVAWLPDSFGFCWQLPQFLKQGGIEYFVTQKMLWNDTNQFPHDVFWWEAPDGTRIFSLMSAPIGEGIEPPKISKYAVDWQAKTGSNNPLWLPGVGDRGGGPTRDMLEVGRRWQKSPFLPQLEFTTVVKYLDSLKSKVAATAPVWRDELYLEFHRGCYTTHADQKLINRRCEDLLYQAELFASVASISLNLPYPKAELESAWKKVLFNQFHDILPGTAIPQVYVDANCDWVEAKRMGEEILQRSLDAIASRVYLDVDGKGRCGEQDFIASQAVPIVVFNSLNWERTDKSVLALSQLVTLSNPKSNWAVWDSSGNKVPFQHSNGELLFLAEGIPGVGYKLFWLVAENEANQETNFQAHTFSDTSISIPEKTQISQTINLAPEIWELENEFIRVKIDSETGDIASIFDKLNQQEILDSQGGNQLQAFTDKGQYWDAWNIDPNYEQHQLPPLKLTSIEWREKGELRQLLRVKRLLDKSEFIQDYILECNSPILKIATQVDWQEKHVLVKAAFNFNWETDTVAYEIPCGVINRTTHPQTPEEKAKWEVPGFRWADFPKGDGYGVTLLNDCKYGWDAKPNQLRLTLLRGTEWPDPGADVGYHEFTYAIYPHAGNWQEAQSVRKGYELNQPMLTAIATRRPVRSIATRYSSEKIATNSNEPYLPNTGQLLNLGADNLVLMTLKAYEKADNGWVLRCYESNGKTAEVKIKSDLGLNVERSLDLLERPKPELKLSVQPWEITTFMLEIPQATSKE